MLFYFKNKFRRKVSLFRKEKPMKCEEKLGFTEGGIYF